MALSTRGWLPKKGTLAWRTGIELLSSMRFSITLLTLVCIASVLGTLLKQNEPNINYINQFGVFWARVFDVAQLTHIYSAWWFMLILLFLVTSTSLCVLRNAPKIARDWHVYKENLRVQNLSAFAHQFQTNGQLMESVPTSVHRIQQVLQRRGWRVKTEQRPNGTMLAAKAGAVNKLGYIAAHTSIVLVCVGGLLDGDWMLRGQMAWHGVSMFSGGGLISKITAEHRLPPSNLAFRGNVSVSEGSQSSTAVLNQGKGVVIQDLPFAIELKKFVVEHYSTGMPKLFASDIVIHDKKTGERTTARVEVNHPVTHSGIEIYQSSFDDGGSAVELQSIPLPALKAENGEIQNEKNNFIVKGSIGENLKLNNGTQLELTALRVLNVENFAKLPSSAVDFGNRMGAANKIKTNKALRNIGPSITYKLRDLAGQATEFHNYMQPVVMEEGEAPVFLLGLRTNAVQDFSYLRIPADDKQSMQTFLQLYSALQQPTLRALAVNNYVQRQTRINQPELAKQLALSSQRTLDLFAKDGLQGIAQFIESNVPENDRLNASAVLIKILNGNLAQLLALQKSTEQSKEFLTQALVSLSDMRLYSAPNIFMLTDFTQVQASVFQVTKAPGKMVVYLGCVLLILGVFAMLFVRERRLWVWLPTQGNAHMALSTNRKTMDGDQEFYLLTRQLLGASGVMERSS